jgi:hypothetical protein
MRVGWKPSCRQLNVFLALSQNLSLLVRFSQCFDRWTHFILKIDNSLLKLLLARLVQVLLIHFNRSLPVSYGPLDLLKLR